MTVFHYTAKEWKPIAVLLGGWSMETKEAIELIINAYRKAPTADEQRARIRSEQKKMAAVSKAAEALLYELDLAGWDYVRPEGGSLREDLEGIVYWLPQESELLEERKPANRSDPRRAALLAVLCRYWYGTLGKTDSPSTDRQTGKVNETPAIAFLTAATARIFRNYPLTKNMARDAIDEHFGRNRKKKREGPTGKAIPADLPATTPSAPDEFDLAADSYGEPDR
jgi:hypothetical protein